MQAATIKGEKREKLGNTGIGRLRKRGLVPAVIYGHKEAPELVALDGHDLEMALQQHAKLLKLNVDSKESQYLLKEVQFDHLQKNPLHVDLMRVDADERVRVQVDIHLVGTPKGVKEGGQLLQQMVSLQVECPVLEIPDEIKVDIESLSIGHALHISELTLPKGVKALGAPNEVVASIVARKDEAAPVAGAEGEASAEPEVITRGKADEEGAEEKK